MTLEYVWKILREVDLQGVCNVTDDLMCSICGNIMINAHIGKCGCRFCLECVTKYLGGEVKTCPQNLEDCQEECLDLSKNIHPDYATQRKILRLIVKCPQDWCEFRDELKKIEAHERVCQKCTFDCPYRSIGCQETQSVKAKIDEHLLKGNELHAGLLIDCLGVLHNEIGLVKNDFQYLRGERKEQEVMEESEVDRINYTNQEMHAVEKDNISTKGEIATQKLEMRTFRMVDMELLTSIEQQLLEIKSQGQMQATEIKDLTKENKTIMEENESMKIENQSMKDQIASIKNENISIKEENQSIKNEIESTKEALDRFRTESVQLINSVTQESSELRAWRQTMASEMEYLKEEIKSMKEENRLIKNESRSIKDELGKSQAANVESLKRELSEVRTQGQTQATEVECLNQEIDLLKMESKSIKEESESISNTNKSIKEELDSFRTEYIELYALVEHQISDINTQAQAQKTEVETENREIHAVKKDNQFILEENISIREKNKSIAMEIEAIKEDSKLVLAENRSTKEDNDSMKDDIESMHEELTDLNADHAELLEVLEQYLSKRRIRGQSRTREMSQSRARYSHDETKLGNDKGHGESQVASENDPVRKWQMDINNSLSSKGDFVWSIDNWARWTGSTQGGECQQIFSGPFYSQERGYKMCLSATSVKGYLYVRWHLMTGDHDDKLRWPLEGSVIISIINQQTFQVHTSYRVTSDGSPDYRWNKPTRKLNDGFGKPFWVRLSDLSVNREVCKDDRIFIRCSVKVVPKKRN